MPAAYRGHGAQAGVAVAHVLFAQAPASALQGDLCPDAAEKEDSWPHTLPMRAWSTIAGTSVCWLRAMPLTMPTGSGAIAAARAPVHVQHAASRRAFKAGRGERLRSTVDADVLEVAVVAAVPRAQAAVQRGKWQRRRLRPRRHTTPPDRRAFRSRRARIRSVAGGPRALREVELVRDHAEVIQAEVPREEPIRRDVEVRCPKYPSSMPKVCQSMPKYGQTSVKISYPWPSPRAR